MLKIILQFILSGAVVVLASQLATKVDQKWAGLLVAAPLMTLLTFVVLSVGNSDTNLKDYLGAALVYMIPAAFFVASLLVFSGRMHYILNIAVSFCVFVAVVLVIQKLNVA